MVETFAHGRAHSVRAHITVVAITLLSACGGSSPTAPTPQFPQVAGSYSGAITIAFPEVPSSVTCPGSTAVTQSGASVSIAPLILGGQCGNLSIPFGPVTIDTTGNISGSGTSGTITQGCGTYNFTGSGGFFGRDLRLSINATSLTCLNFNFTAVLTR